MTSSLLVNLQCNVGIDKLGCGNWKNVADYIGTKNIKQVEEHYWEVKHDATQHSVILLEKEWRGE